MMPVDYRTIIAVVITTCLIICTIALGHLAWGW